MASRTTRRRVLQTLPIVALASPVSMANALAQPIGNQIGAVPCHPPGRVNRLARALSVALPAHSGGKFGIIVRPAGYVDEPVAVIDLAEAHDAAYSLSGGLVQAICAHVAAYSALGRASRAADAVRLGRKPTADELDRLDDAGDKTDVALMALCRHPTRNGPERKEKAGYLLGFARDGELADKHIMAILESFAEPLNDHNSMGHLAAMAHLP